MSTPADSTQGKIRVEVAWATPDRQILLSIEVHEGCTLGEAIRQSGIRDQVNGLVVDLDAVGIFGRRLPSSHVLRAGDRVEIYRPLIADPKEARRRRAEQKKET